MKETSLLRNIGIIAHIDAGKTTTTERILYYTGKTYYIGNVDEGNTIMDYMIQEKERGITITSAVTTASWGGKIINIIDTPGHVDFTAEVERSLRVLDGGVIVFSAVEGVQAQSETVWRQADRYHVPRIIYINKMDRTGADYEKVIASCVEKLNARPVRLQIPIGSEENFVGVIDIIKKKKYIFNDPTGETYLSEDLALEELKLVEHEREKVYETLANVDEEALVNYIDKSFIPDELLIPIIRRATISNLLTPVVCGSSFRNKGIQLLLDAIVDFLPSPLDVKPAIGKNIENGEKVEIKPLPDEPLTALVFKILSDPYVGLLSFVRVYSGVLKAGSYILNSSTGEKLRVSRLLRMHANKREDIEELAAGDLGAVVGLKNTVTGHTLCDENHSIILETIKFPEPVISVAIEPKTQADKVKLSASLAKFSIEDPTFKIKFDEESSETIISGMGELHLEIIVDRLLREYGVNAKVGDPQVSYKESIEKSVKVEGKYIRQTGGRGQYGHVVLEIGPQERGKGIDFENKIVGGAIPKQYISAVEEGIKEASLTGVLLGFPVVDLKVLLVDGSFHPVDSSEMAFKIAASKAFKEGIEKAKTYLLEPIMALEVVVPKNYIGDVIASINSRRGNINQLVEKGNLQIIEANVPLANMFGYATILRSITQGRGAYSMEFAKYERVPKEIENEIIKKYEGF